MLFFLLQPIKLQFETNLSWADLIVLVGNTALEKVGGKHLEFCGDRTDAADGLGSEFLFSKITGNFSESLLQF
jgi:catalase (peroxidase I)